MYIYILGGGHTPEGNRLYFHWCSGVISVPEFTYDKNKAAKNMTAIIRKPILCFPSVSTTFIIIE